MGVTFGRDTNSLPIRMVQRAKSVSVDSSRIPAIDVFRFICIISVAIFHYTVRWQPPRWSAGDLPGHHIQFPELLNIGALGVQVFFVISGLVISQSLAKAFSMGEFAFRRFARLYPAFLIGATISYCAKAFFGIPAFAITFWDYLNNISLAILFGSRAEFVEGAYWSLAVELRFYVMAAFFWSLMRQRFWIGLLFVSTALAITRSGPLHEWAMPEYMPFFLAGVGLWLVLLAGRLKEGVLLVATSVIILMFTSTRISPLGHLYICTLVGTMAFTIYVQPNLSLGPIARLGEASYSMYLIHEGTGISLMHWMSSRFKMNDIAKITLTIFIIYFLAYLIFLIEKPARNWLGTQWRRFQFSL